MNWSDFRFYLGFLHQHVKNHWVGQNNLADYTHGKPDLILTRTGRRNKICTFTSGNYSKVIEYNPRTFLQDCESIARQVWNEND